MYKFIIKTFDQLKNDNFDQVKFDQVIIPQIEGEVLCNKLNKFHTLEWGYGFFFHYDFLECNQKIYILL